MFRLSSLTLTHSSAAWLHILECRVVNSFTPRSHNFVLILFILIFSHQSGFTPLHIACVYGHFELAKLLLEAGADIEAKTKNGYMALHLAAQYGHALIINLLLENGAPPDALTNVRQSKKFAEIHSSANQIHLKTKHHIFLIKALIQQQLN